MIGIGFYKHLAYEHDNSEYSYLYDDESVNAYVGGAAYNYIINGTYFTAYSVLGIGSLIIATIAGDGVMFISVEQEPTRTNELKYNYDRLYYGENIGYSIELLFVAWLKERNDIKCAEEAMGIYQFVEKNKERILQNIGCKQP